MTVNRKSMSGLETTISMSGKKVTLILSERVAIIAIILAAELGLVWMWQQRAMLMPPVDNQPEITLPQVK